MAPDPAWAWTDPLGLWAAADREDSPRCRDRGARPPTWGGRSVRGTRRSRHGARARGREGGSVYRDAHPLGARRRGRGRADRLAGVVGGVPRPERAPRAGARRAAGSRGLFRARRARGTRRRARRRPSRARAVRSGGCQGHRSALRGRRRHGGACRVDGTSLARDPLPPSSCRPEGIGMHPTSSSRTTRSR